jgi:hypothetical protein
VLPLRHRLNVLRRSVKRPKLTASDRFSGHFWQPLGGAGALRCSTIWRDTSACVDSCLEEMLLHTNEGVGPHTKTTLKFIQQLKKKHGIDYDCHASYRFVEE